VVQGSVFVPGACGSSISLGGFFRRLASEERRMSQQSAVIGLPAVKTRAAELIQAFAAMALGLLIVGMVGFSHLDVVHNAAHDVRHSNAFPCH